MKKHRNRFGGSRTRLSLGKRTAGQRNGYVCFEPLESRVLLAGNGVSVSLRDFLNVGISSSASVATAVSSSSTTIAPAVTTSTPASTTSSSSNSVPVVTTPVSTPVTSLTTPAVSPVPTSDTPITSSFSALVDSSASTSAITPDQSTTSTLNPTGTPSVSIALEAVDSSGNPISTIQVGQTFDLEAVVKDLRQQTTSGEGFGVYAAFLNTAYNSSLATVTGPLTFVSPFQVAENPPDYPDNAPPNVEPAAPVPGQISEAGASSNSLTPESQSPGPPAQVLWSATVQATAPGVETFTASPDTATGHDVLTFGEDAAIPTADVAYSNASVTITAGSLPVVSISSVSQNEGNSGTTPFVFNLTLSSAAAAPVTVAYATADGTATVADNDYVAQSGTVTFATGVTTQSVTILVNGDTKFEANETFTVNLSHPSSNAALGVATGTGTIVNDDTAPSLSISDVTQTKGTSGLTPFVFDVTLSAPSGVQTTVDYYTADGTATVANNDYQPLGTAAAPLTLTFAPGTTTEAITVSVVGNTAVNANETFTVNLANATNASISNSKGTGTIVSGPALPTLSIDNVSQLDGTSGTTPFVFTVTLSSVATSPVTVAYATADGTATIANNDYVSNTGTLTFATGTTTQTITVAVVGTTTVEPSETFFVNLSDPSGATVSSSAGTGTGTIENDNVGPPTVSINSVSENEGSSGTTPFIFAVTLSAAATSPVTVAYATADGTATVANGDYVAQSGTLTFATGVTTETITIAVLGNTTAASGETFSVNLSSPSSNAVLGTSAGVGTILNDNSVAPTPALSINNVSLNEGTSGTTNFVFTVTLSSAATSPVTVAFATADGTATVANDDYVAQSGTLTFATGVTSETITVAVLGNTTAASGETFSVNLSGASANATISSAQGIGTIINDNGQSSTQSLSINDVSQFEGTSGTSNFVFTVTLSAAATSPVTVDYATADGTATVASDDYTAASGTLTFAAGTTTQTITVAVNGGMVSQANENFVVNLSDASSGTTISTAQGVGTILGQQEAAADISERDFLNTSVTNSVSSSSVSSNAVTNAALMSLLSSSSSSAASSSGTSSSASPSSRALLSDAALGDPSTLSSSWMTTSS